MKKQAKAETNTAATSAPASTLPCWECVALPDSALDENADGQQVYLNTSTDYSPTPFPVRLTVTARAKPFNLFRVDGKWRLSFDLLPEKDADGEFTFTVEVGEGGPLTFEEATRLLFGC